MPDSVQPIIRIEKHDNERSTSTCRHLTAQIVLLHDPLEDDDEKRVTQDGGDQVAVADAAAPRAVVVVEQEAHKLPQYRRYHHGDVERHVEVNHFDTWYTISQT